MRIHKFVQKMDRVLESICMVLLACIIVAAVLQVFTRKVLGSSMVGTEEFARYCFIWMSCLGASLCLTKGSHASVDILKDHINGKGKIVHALITNVVVLFVCYVMIRYGFTLLKTVSRQSSPTMGLPMHFVYSALPVASVFMVITTIAKIADNIFSLKNYGKEDGQ